MKKRKIIISCIAILSIIAVVITLLKTKGIDNTIIQGKQLETGLSTEAIEEQEKLEQALSDAYLTKKAEWIDIDNGIGKITLKQTGNIQQKSKDVVLIMDRSGSMTFAHDFYTELYPDESYLEMYPDNLSGLAGKFSPCMNEQHYKDNNHYYNVSTATEGQEQDDFDKEKGCTDRFDIAIEAIDNFMDIFSNKQGTARVAYTSFAATAAYEQDFSTEKTVIMRNLKSTQETLTAGTQYDVGINSAIEIIKNRNLEDGGTADTNTRDTYVLFLTDGRPNEEHKGITEAETLKAMGTKVYTIGIGDAERETLAQIASATSYCTLAESAQDIIDAYADIANQIKYIGINATIEDKISKYYDYYEDETHKPTATPTLLPQDSADGKTIQWKVQEINIDEKEWSFYVKIKDEYTPGIRDTNTAATLTYTDASGNKVIKEVETPKLSIGKYRIEYYKQNSDGKWNSTPSEFIEKYSTVGSTITAPQKTYEGYTLDKTIAGTNLQATLNSINTSILKLYYTKDIIDVPYKIEYYYDGKIGETETHTGQSGQTITLSQQQIDSHLKEGFKYNPTEPMVLSRNAEDNILKVYYTTIDGLNYTVKYIDKETDNKLQEDKIVGGKKYGDIVKEDAPKIPGYKLEVEENQTIKIGDKQNEIIFYYSKRNDLSYTVKYLDKNTNQEIATSKIVQNQTYKTVIEEKAINIDGYKAQDPTTISIEINEENADIKFYYTKIDNTISNEALPKTGTENIFICIIVFITIIGVVSFIKIKSYKDIK